MYVKVWNSLRKVKREKRSTKEHKIRNSYNKLQMLFWQFDQAVEGWMNKGKTKLDTKNMLWLLRPVD